VLVEDCAQCGDELRFMEGPLCDECLDKNELRAPGSDPYWHYGDGPEARRHRGMVLDEIDSQHDVVFSGRPRLVVDLVAKRVLYASGEKTKPIYI
jgi:hypothetical protein